jgi:WD40 repeat protein
MAPGDIVIRNLETNTSLHLELGEYTGEFSGLMTFFADDTRLAAIGNDGVILTWKVSNGELITPAENDLPSDLKLATTRVFSPTGDYLAYVYAETNLRVWDLKNNKLYANIGSEIELPVGAITFSSDGKLLAYSEGSNIALWDMQAKKPAPERPLPTEADFINQLSLVLEGDTLRYVISVDESGNTQIWDWEKHIKLGNSMPGLKIIGINTLKKLAYYIDPRGRIIQWQWNTDLTDPLCSLVKRNFTLDEWQTFFGEKQYPAQSDLPCPDYPPGN